jgi:hypothetical protein
MDTSQDTTPAVTAAVPMVDETPVAAADDAKALVANFQDAKCAMELELEKALDETTDDEKQKPKKLPNGNILVTFEASSTGGKGKKNSRFGKNADGTPAKKVDKHIERKSEWGKFLHKYKLEHPDVYGLQATMDARKVYVPKSGKQKSFERIFTEVWKQKNPDWQRFDKEQRLAAIRADFIKAI